MSVSSEINRLIANLADCYLAVQEKGGTLPAVQNSTNLPTAIGTIKSGATIPSSSSSRGSIQNQIIRLSAEVANSYNVCNQLGATMPVSWNTNNLADCIRSIPITPPIPVNEYISIKNVGDYECSCQFIHTYKNGQVSWIRGGGLVYYSYDKLNWEEMLNGETTVKVILEPNDTIYLKSDDFANIYYSYHYDAFSLIFDSDNIAHKARVKISGNISSLHNFEEQAQQDYIYSNLFLGDQTRPGIWSYCEYIDCSGLYLLSEGTSKECYSQMFRQNQAQIIPPVFLDTYMAESCCSNMFAYCYNLTIPPELPSTNLGCGCYQAMFYYCPALVRAPELPATTLADYCYLSMFAYCSSLTVAPELPATTLVQECYYSMFSGCSSLKEITVNFTNWNNSGNYSTYYWVDGVAERGDFYCPSTLPIERGISRIPEGWTYHNS